MNAKILCPLLLCLLTLPAVAADFKVIVNTSNPATTLTKDQISEYLMKRTLVWPDGRAVVAVDQRPDSPVRAAFSLQIIGRAATAVKNHWHQQIFSGRAIPPAERNGDHAVIEFVKASPGAVGYVSASADTTGVKVITVR